MFKNMNYVTYNKNLLEKIPNQFDQIGYFDINQDMLNIFSGQENTKEVLSEIHNIALIKY
jgi:hypothetical protein